MTTAGAIATINTLTIMIASKHSMSVNPDWVDGVGGCGCLSVFIGYFQLPMDLVVGVGTYRWTVAWTLLFIGDRPFKSRSTTCWLSGTQ